MTPIERAALEYGDGQYADCTICRKAIYHDTTGWRSVLGNKASDHDHQPGVIYRAVAEKPER
ncbi:MAG: hypothetical protein ACRDSK_13720 [Actinophytocola sp.]|uniref:hypothetical protein n=1 Tax=Actinophytocola sp. TaxID=1872138 RepID=UPI003D6ADBB6